MPQAEYHLWGFNPLPSQKQGETVRARQEKSLAEVSIRSPHKSKGRHVLEHEQGQVGVFQSAPLTKARGDPERKEKPF